MVLSLEYIDDIDLEDYFNEVEHDKACEKQYHTEKQALWNQVLFYVKKLYPKGIQIAVYTNVNVSSKQVFLKAVFVKV